MLAYLIRQSRSLLAAAVAAGVVSGLCSVLLLAQINTALTAEDGAARAQLVWPFAIVVALSLFSHAIASILFERLSQQTGADVRRLVSSRVMAADYRRLEEIGGPAIQSALSEHSANVAGFFVIVPVLVVNGVIVTGCLAYLAWLSPTVFAAAVAVIGLGSLGYHLAHLRAMRYLSAAAREQDKMFGLFRALIDGAKELRLHRGKRIAFAAKLLHPVIETVRRQRVIGMSIFVVSSSWGNFLIYAFIGLVLFTLADNASDQAAVMTGFALVFVYMVTPLQTLLLNLPRANLARASAERVAQIIREMPEADLVADTEAEVAAPLQKPLSIEMRGIRRQYYHESKDDIFALGPVDLTFAPGELVFLVGGNGSGKTTLAKVLVGLYRPDEGTVLVDGVPVGEGDRDRYRQHFSAVFSDYYLFDQLLAVETSQLEMRANRLLEKLHLHHKVQVRDGAFTTQALSQGQRKRLALVAAWLENRPFIVFDEWAADQDPAFKELFYREILPELRAAGKTVLAITHDDRYFRLADRLIRMEDGRVIAAETPPQHVQAVAHLKTLEASVT